MLGQRLLRELPNFDARLQQDLDDGSNDRFGAVDNFGRSKQPHGVDKSDHVLLVAAESELVPRRCSCQLSPHRRLRNPDQLRRPCSRWCQDQP